MKIKQITRIALFTAAVISVQLVIPSILIPFIQVPFTMQTLLVMLVAVILPPLDSFICISLYVIIGAMGLPVFSGYEGGLQVIFGPTGGFILAFPFASFFISLLKGNKSFSLLFILNAIFGIIFVYLFGSISLSIHYEKPFYVMLVGLLVLIPFDMIKALIASYLGSKITIFNR